MNRLPEFAVRRPVVVIALVLIAVAWGLGSFLTMPRREDPEFTIKVCVISTEWAGASAQKVEELVTDPLEEVLDGIEEVKLLRSTSANGRSTIFVELDDALPGSEVDAVWDKVHHRVKNVPMPESGLTPIVNDQFGDTSIILFAVHQVPLPEENSIDPENLYSPRMLDIYSERVRDDLRLLPGVAKVERFGVRQEAIYIETDAGTWSRTQLTADQLASMVQGRNIVAPGGVLDTGDGRFFVKPGGEFDGVREIETLVTGLSQSENVTNVHLSDLGLKVRRDYVEPPDILCRYTDDADQYPAVMVAVTMKSGANIIDICQSARRKVHELQSVTGKLPPDLAVDIISDQSTGVESRIQDVILNIVEAIVIVVVVVYLVVGFRIAAVMAANIPFVVLSSLAIITLFGVELEQMSLASMIIALGLLVDNAVQVCDQARTNQMAGMNPTEAAVRGAQTLASSMLNGTLTTVAAFVPMLIAMDGSNREFIYSLPVTLSVMLGISWILAMTFCVILSAWFIRAPREGEQSLAPIPRAIDWYRRIRKRPAPSGQQTGFFYRWYSQTAQWALRHKFATIAGAFLMLILTFQLSVSSEFFPLTERDQFAVEVWLPETATIEQTEETTANVEAILQKLSSGHDAAGKPIERIQNMRTMIGGGGSRWYLSWEPEAPKPNFAEILVHTSDGSFTHDLAEQLRVAVNQGLPELGIEPVAGARVVPIELFLGPPADPVVLRVSGDGFADIRQLRQIADQVQSLVAAHPETWAVSNSWGSEGFQLQVDIDPERATMSGVSNSQIAATLDAYFSGRLLTRFREGDHQIPVYFRLSPEGRHSLQNVREAFVEGSAGKVPLTAVADIHSDWEPAFIDRRDLNRTMEIRARVNAGASGNDITAQVMNSEEMESLKQQLPPGFRVEIGGALEESLKAQGKMMMSFGISLVTIFLLLVIQFGSVSKTLVIIGTLPLALIGSLLGLWLTDNALGFMPQLGILALFGIVLNSGILLMEFADIQFFQNLDQQKRQGTATGPILGLTAPQFRQAIVEAGRQRLLPIFLTTATTVGGLIPLAIAGGPLWEGMAWLMIFGLMVATLLTLYVVPALFTIIVETFGLRPFQRESETTN